MVNRAERAILSLIALLGLLWVAQVLAQTPTLQNGGFEITYPSMLSPGQIAYFNEPITPTNWVKWSGYNTAYGYVYYRTTNDWQTDYPGVDRTPFQNVVLGLGRAGVSSIYQVLGTVTAGERYTLSGYLGRPVRQGSNAPAAFHMRLLVGTNSWPTGSTIIAEVSHATLADPALGTWKYFSMTSTNPITAEQNGQYLMVFLYAANGTWPSVREFDCIQFSIVQTNSVLAGIERGTGISWFASNAVTYQVQWTTPPAVPESVWSNLTGLIVGDGRTNTVFDPMPGAPRAYRVISIE